MNTLPLDTHESFTLSPLLPNGSQMMMNTQAIYDNNIEVRSQGFNSSDIINQLEHGKQSLQNTHNIYNQLLSIFKVYIDNDKDIQTQLYNIINFCSEHYTNEIKHLRLIVNLKNIYDMPNNFISLIKTPYISLPAFENSVKEIWDEMIKSSKIKVLAPRIGFIGWLGDLHISPRGLSSNMLNCMVAVDGIVNKTSSVNPKLSLSVYVGESTENSLSNSFERSVYLRPHYDITDLDKSLRDSANPPANDPNGKIVHKLEYGLSKYKNHQKFVIQETPETAPTGQLPRWVDVIVEDDLVDKVKTGDRVRVWGVYKIWGGRPDALYTKSFTSKPYLIANNLQKLNKKTNENFSDKEIACFKEFSQRDDVLEIMERSFAPSICGLEIVKRGIILSLFGGSERVKESGHHIRGDIHILLVGDPSCGKSQLLRYLINMIPGSISANGRGSSGVGLTAAVLLDPDTGERRVEAGAMVMGDLGIVCIDEFDKMHKNDRVAIHEIMEQQTVSVAKAGVYTTLNARCTIIAAANPLYGCWSDHIEYRKQISFEDSLLSRFDLIFLIRDTTTELEDERISDAVLTNITQKAKPSSSAYHSKSGDNNYVIQPDNQVFEDSNAIKNHEEDSINIFSPRHDMLYLDRSGINHEVLSTKFLQRYISYANNYYYEQNHKDFGWNPYPEVSEEAGKYLIDFYVELRQRSKSSHKFLMQSVTPRTLEAIVRIATAHAKIKLKRWVTKDDVNVARSLLLYTIFGEDINEMENDEFRQILTDSNNIKKKKQKIHHNTNMHKDDKNYPQSSDINQIIQDCIIDQNIDLELI